MVATEHLQACHPVGPQHGDDAVVGVLAHAGQVAVKVDLPGRQRVVVHPQDVDRVPGEPVEEASGQAECASKKSFIRVADSTPRLRLSDSLFGGEYPRLTSGGVRYRAFASGGRAKNPSIAAASPAITSSATPWPTTWTNPTVRHAASIAVAACARAGPVIAVPGCVRRYGQPWAPG